MSREKKAIVSTHTINLQEQLLHKDIPIVQKILPIEFEAALMKGRQNYLCPRRLERAIQQANELFNTTEQADLARLADWARTTTDGTLSDFPIEPDPKVWSPGLQRSAHLHDKNLRTKSALLFPAGEKTIAGRGPGRD